MGRRRQSDPCETNGALAMRVLLVADHYPVCLARYMRDSYRRLGADVRSVGPAQGTAIWGSDVAPERVWQPDGPIDTVWADWLPEVVIYSTGVPFQFNPQYRGVPHVVHTVDNHVVDFRQEGIDHYFLAHGHGQAMPVQGPDVTWLPCAYDPVFFTPSPIAWSQRRFDVSLIGAPYPNRVELLNAIKAAGFNVCAGVGAVYEQFRDIYHNTRISLCLSACGDVAQRVFETAAMRCLILTDPCPDLPDLRADGITVYHSVADAVQKVRQILANPALAQAAVERTFAWAKPHTWDARAQVILRWVKDHKTAPT